MIASLQKNTTPKGVQTVTITGSKSETNRLLILQALYPNIRLQNVSNSDDSKVLLAALEKGNGEIDVHHAGTAMRFLTAYFAAQANTEVVLTGSERMKERPIGILVDALRQLGAAIDYLENEGFPPLRIQGKTLQKSRVTIAAGVSSQYISALMLIGPSLAQGIELQLQGKITSTPYINMTLALLKQLGIPGTFEDHTIRIPSYPAVPNTAITVESDWSSASYFYSLVSLSEGLEIELTSYRENSLQGDSALMEFYEPLGVSTQVSEVNHSIRLKKTATTKTSRLELDLANTPDIAQTLAVSCFGLGIGCYFTGLHTLKIKETDRLLALKTELEKLGASVQISDNSLELQPAKKINQRVSIDTYNDHRMAMAFAPLALKVPINIRDCMVVSKSYPDFYEDLQKVGLQIDFQ